MTPEYVFSSFNTSLFPKRINISFALVTATFIISGSSLLKNKLFVLPMLSVLYTDSIFNEKRANLRKKHLEEYIKVLEELLAI